jgi:branched-chain amino acid transport system permease protein
VLQPEAAYPQTVLLMAFLLAVMAMSWNIISGFAGYISLGHSAFLGLGAYTAGILSLRWGVNPLYLVPLGGLVATATAVGVRGDRAARPGHAFVIITIALLLGLQVCAVNFSGITNGSDGITLPLPAWPSRLQNIPFYYLFLALMLATFGFTAWIRRTKFGTGLVAIREDEGKAAAIGVSTTTYKILGYAASAVFIGTGGRGLRLLPHVPQPGRRLQHPGQRHDRAGRAGRRAGHVWGPLIGAFIVQILSEVATVQAGGSGNRLILLGLALMVVVLFLPAGLLPTIASLLARSGPAAPRWSSCSRPPRCARARSRCTRLPRPASAPAAAAGGSRRRPPVRRAHRRRRNRPERRRGQHHGPDRAERLRQDHAVQPRHRRDRADRGEILSTGERIDRMPPWRRAHRGLGRTFQVTGCSADDRAGERGRPLPEFRWRTLAAGRRHRPGGVARQGVARRLRAGPVRRPGRRHAVLRPAEAGRARAGAHAQPRLILLDEPAGGSIPAWWNGSRASSGSSTARA